MAEALIVIKAALAVGQGLLQIWRSANGKPSKSARQAAGADAKRDLTDILEHIRSLQKETAKINHKDRPALETLKEKLTKWIKKAQELLQKNSLTEEDVLELQQHKIKAFEIFEFQVKIMKELNAQKQPPRVPPINPNVINIINLNVPTTENIAGPSAAGASAAGAIESSGRNHKRNTTRPGNQRITGQKGKDKEKDKNHSTSDIKGKAASGERKPGDNSKGETNPEKQKSMAHEKGKDREKEKKPGTTGKDKEKEKKPGTTGKDKEKEKKPRTSTGSKGDTHKS